MRSYRLTDYDIAMVVSNHVFEAVLTALGGNSSQEQVDAATKLSKVARDLTPETLHRKFPHHEVTRLPQDAAAKDFSL